MSNHEGMYTDLKQRLVLAALLLLPLFSANEAHADYKVSCVQNGKIVFSKTFGGDVNETQRERVSNRYKNALCLFLNADTPAATGGDAAKALISAWGGDVMDEDLKSALSIISAGGEDVPVEVSKTPTVLGESGVDVVIGVYDGVDMVTVVEHWKSAAEGSRWLALFEPVFRSTDDIITVTLNNVPDVIISKVCEDAEKAGYRCTTFF